MSQIKAADVKKLREMTGAGMMDCKKALMETHGDFDAAVDLLRKKGLSAAAKKAGRVAAEGVVTVLTEGDKGVVLEVNAETDFVSKNEKFVDFVSKVARIVLEKNPADVDALKALPFDDENTVEQALATMIATIGENMNIRRFKRIEVKGGKVDGYVHGAGKIGVLIGFEGEIDDSTAHGIAMHIAAANPAYISRDDVDEAVVERERTVLRERAAATGKPEAIIEKIVAGQLNKFYSEVCLLEQDFVVDPDKKVGDVLGDAKVVEMARFQLGEGIDKKESNFAAEVAAQVQGG